MYNAGHGTAPNVTSGNRPNNVMKPEQQQCVNGVGIPGKGTKPEQRNGKPGNGNGSGNGNATQLRKPTG
jgi:hypothetical protein